MTTRRRVDSRTVGLSMRWWSTSHPRTKLTSVKLGFVKLTSVKLTSVKLTTVKLTSVKLTTVKITAVTLTTVPFTLDSLRLVAIYGFSTNLSVILFAPGTNVIKPIFISWCSKLECV